MIPENVTPGKGSGANPFAAYKGGADYECFQKRSPPS